jgi:hypothetical protein
MFPWPGEWLYSKLNPSLCWIQFNSIAEIKKCLHEKIIPRNRVTCLHILTEINTVKPFDVSLLNDCSGFSAPFYAVHPWCLACPTFKWFKITFGADKTERCNRQIFGNFACLSLKMKLIFVLKRWHYLWKNSPKISGHFIFSLGPILGMIDNTGCFTVSRLVSIFLKPPSYK